MFTVSQIPEINSQLTLEEKASLLSGEDFWHTQAIERLNIPALMVSDGPHGLRKQDTDTDHLGLNTSVPATCFPTAAGLASSWNPELLAEIGEALAEEAKAQNVGVILGPGVNLKRSPLCGRNFEYFSEDPLLTATLASSLINGIQSKGVGTSLKHFAVNNQESDRMRVNAIVDERTLYELYLSVFERIVKSSQPATIMCSYNRINDCFSSDNRWLLTEVLRDDWDFQGLVVTDWGAVHDRPVGVHAGLDLEMPSSNGLNDKKIVEAVKANKLSEEDVNRAVERVLSLIAKYSQNSETTSTFNVDDHHELAAIAATQSAVLLTNDDALPLPNLDDAVVIGEMARTPRYQGAGSSQVNPTKMTSPLDALRARKPDIEFAPGYCLEATSSNETTDSSLIADAAKLATNKIALLFIGLPASYESEGFDRTDISLPDSHLRLIDAVRNTAKKVIVLLSNGSAIETRTWQSKADAILELWLPGQAGGEGAARLITGEASPSGRLSEGFAEKLSDHPAQLNFPGENSEVRYGEGLFIGYRAFDKMEKSVSFPFGHGLTYTRFDYRNLEVKTNEITEDSHEDDVAISATITIKNTGKRAGVAVPQLYVGYLDSKVVRPVRELRAFDRILLKPNESKTVTMTVSVRELSFWNVESHKFQVEPGNIQVEIGESSRDIKARKTVTITAPELMPKLTASATLSQWKAVPDAWADLSNNLGALGESMTKADPNDVTFAILRDMPVDRIPLIFPDGLTPQRLHELVQKWS